MKKNFLVFVAAFALVLSVCLSAGCGHPVYNSGYGYNPPPPVVVVHHGYGYNGGYTRYPYVNNQQVVHVYHHNYGGSYAPPVVVHHYGSSYGGSRTVHVYHH